MPSYKDQLYGYYYDDMALSHHGVKGQRWGVRRYQNEDGSLTVAGQRRQAVQNARATYKQAKNKAIEKDENRRDRNYEAYLGQGSGNKSRKPIGYFERDRRNRVSSNMLANDLRVAKLEKKVAINKAKGRERLAAYRERQLQGAKRTQKQTARKSSDANKFYDKASTGEKILASISMKPTMYYAIRQNGYNTGKAFVRTAGLSALEMAANYNYARSIV